MQINAAVPGLAQFGTRAAGQFRVAVESEVRMAGVRITGYRTWLDENGFRCGLNTIGAIKAIRLHAGINLAAAKEQIEAVVTGATVTVDVPGPDEAQVLTGELIAFGANAEVVE